VEKGGDLVILEEDVLRRACSNYSEKYVPMLTAVCGGLKELADGDITKHENFVSQHVYSLCERITRTVADNLTSTQVVRTCLQSIKDAFVTIRGFSASLAKTVDVMVDSLFVDAAIKSS